ncbi:MAG: hypothetical protein K6E29_04725 [Cyanobacteria bacterium RUI128]|nr:hypothetical protein [Cyanobacteria bacterium RUI128]
MFILCTSSVFGEGYNVLVIPSCYVRNVKKPVVKSVDVEELLARKFIMKMEANGIAYAPTMNVLRISINNNSKVNKAENDAMENIRILSKAYGVPKVIIITTNTDTNSNAQQKMFWNRLDLPVLIPFEPNMKLTTTVTMYNAKNNEIIWSDVYYKRIGMKDNGVDISDIDSYYDELIPKVFENMRDSKETHAIMVNSPADLINNPAEKINPIKQFIENIKNSFAQKQIEKQEKLLDEKVAEKKAKESKKANKKVINNVVKKPAPNLEIKSDNKKAVQQEETTKKGLLDSIQFKFYIVKQDLFKNIKNEFDNPEKNTVKQQQKTAKKLLKEKQEQEKKESVKKTKSPKEQKSEKKSLVDVMKTKYLDMRIQNAKKQDSAGKEKTVSEQNSSKYKYVINSDDEDSVSANRYIQSKPRYNSRNYIPKYASDVNDM